MSYPIKISEGINIMCDLYRTNLNRFLFSSLMEWNLSYCIFSNIFDDKNQISHKLFSNTEKVKKDIKKNMVMISILTFNNFDINFKFQLENQKPFYIVYQSH